MIAGYSVEKTKVGNKRKLLEHEAFTLLSRYNIPHPPYGLAKSREEALEIASGIGLPVALKIVSPDISHKTDVGGVILGVSSLREVAESYDKIIQNVKAKAPGARIEGILVQKMVENGVEVIIGGVRDPVFSTLIMFGLGGVFTEVLRDVTFRVWPITREEAYGMIHEVRSRSILEGYRGASAVDLDSIVDIILKLGKLLEENPWIESADLNPVKAYPNGSIVVDARFIIGEPY